VSRTLTKCLHRWHHTLCEQRTSRRKIQQSVLKMNKSHLMHCFQLLKHYHRRGRCLVLFLNTWCRIVKRHVTRIVARAYRQWCQCTTGARVQEDKIHALQKRTMLHLSQSLLPRVFFPWKKKYLVHKRHLQLSHRILTRMRRKRLVRRNVLLLFARNDHYCILSQGQTIIVLCQGLCLLFSGTTTIVFLSGTNYYCFLSGTMFVVFRNDHYCFLSGTNYYCFLSGTTVIVLCQAGLLLLLFCQGFIVRDYCFTQCTALITPSTCAF
jgi:hypothetical protein